MKEQKSLSIMTREWISGQLFMTIRKRALTGHYLHPYNWTIQFIVFVIYLKEEYLTLEQINGTEVRQRLW